MERFDEASPRTRARITGAVYLSYFVVAILGELFLQRAGISAISPTTADAGTLARNVLAHEGSLQVGVSLGVISVACYVAVTALFYQLFKPVGKTVALLALAFGIMAMAITALAALFELAPMVALQSSSSGISVGQRQDLALMFLQVGDHLGPISLVFSGLFQLMIGYLMFRSGFLPRVFGLLIAVAGLGWLVFLAPPLASKLMTPLEVLGFLGEVPLMLWLLVMGVNSQRWNERAQSAGLAIALSRSSRER
jgi:uncharacterized protein DUF4386